MLLTTNSGEHEMSKVYLELRVIDNPCTFRQLPLNAYFTFTVINDNGKKSVKVHRKVSKCTYSTVDTSDPNTDIRKRFDMDIPVYRISLVSDFAYSQK